MTSQIGHWQVEETAHGTVFVQSPGGSAWIFTGLTVLLWVGWYVQRESGSLRALDLGLGWGFFLLSMLLLSIGWNRIEVRVTSLAAERRVAPLRVMEGNIRLQGADVAGVHYWQQAVSGERLDRGITRPSYKAGVRLKNGKDIELVGGFSSEPDAARAAEVIAMVWRMTPTRLPRGNELMEWRGILFLLSIVISPIIVARMASFIAALLRG